jgi:hypothetical protein
MLDALVDINLLGSRSASKAQEANLLVAEHSAAAVFLPQIEDLKTVAIWSLAWRMRHSLRTAYSHGDSVNGKVRTPLCRVREEEDEEGEGEDEWGLFNLKRYDQCAVA